MEPLSTFGLRKMEPAKKLRRLPGEKIFEISSFLQRLLNRQEDRTILYKRMRAFAYTRRRGKLRLPSHFPQKVRDLSNLTKSQIRDLLYWVKPSTGFEQPLSKRQYEYVRHLSGVHIWNRVSGADSHTANADGLHRLRKCDAPIINRSRWPSAPSFTEMLEMVRRNVAFLSNLKERPALAVENCLSRSDLSKNLRLATRIVRQQIVGIRSSVEIPEAWLPWFRYRHGFSILSVRHVLPSGLVRFLLAQWKVRHTNLWLVDHCSLKIFLRKHTADDFIVAAKLEIEEVSSFISCTEVSSLSTVACSRSSENGSVAVLDDELFQFVARLPGRN